MTRYYVGWDVGGAHLKLSLLSSCARLLDVQQIAMPLWKGLQPLQEALLCVLRDERIQNAVHGLTMTAELVDLFPKRSVGAKEILTIWQSKIDPDRTYLYDVSGKLLSLASGRSESGKIASANWHATANYFRHHIENAFLIDIGSTTTDITPWINHTLAHRGNTDAERLSEEELIYSGVLRTPVMAICDKLPIAGSWRLRMAEQFADMADVYRLTGWLTTDSWPTSDGRDKSLEQSACRLARMVGEEPNSNDLASWQQLANYLAHCQLEQLRHTLARISSRPNLGKITTLLGAGCGRFLVKILAKQLALHYLDVADLFAVKGNPELAKRAADCAPATALAYLLKEHRKHAHH